MFTDRIPHLAAGLAMAASTLVVVPLAANADQSPGSLPFAQNWSNAALISTSDDWSGVPSITGYRGDGLATTDTDPRTVLADGATSPIDVNAQSTATSTTGGVHESKQPERSRSRVPAPQTHHIS